MHWQAIPYIYDPLGKNIFTRIISGEVFDCSSFGRRLESAELSQSLIG